MVEIVFSVLHIEPLYKHQFPPTSSKINVTMHLNRIFEFLKTSNQLKEIQAW